MLSTEEVNAFNEKGYVRVTNAFSRAEAAEMEDLIWKVLGDKYGAVRDDKSTWGFGAVTGMQTIHADHVFDPIGGEVTLNILDQFLEKGQWRMPSHWGQFLINFPTAGPWALPDAWHTDFAFTTPPQFLPGIVMFSFLSDVAPQGGGTVLLEGSHILMQQFVTGKPAQFLDKMKNVRKAFLASHIWLKKLSQGIHENKEIVSVMEEGYMINGVKLRVVEISGSAGDIVFTHPWLLHSPAPNCGEVPRFMRIQRIRLGS